jgi:hypothetical protein
MSLGLTVRLDVQAAAGILPNLALETVLWPANSS